MSYPIEVMDDNGRVQGWLDSGDTVHVWENQEIGSSQGRYCFTRCERPDGTIFSDIPAAQTCGCQQPTWRYAKSPSVTLTLEGSKARIDGEYPLRIYRKAYVASGLSASNATGKVEQLVPRTEFSDTAAGYRSACKVAAKLNDIAAQGPRLAPLGKFYSTFTVERLSYLTRETRADGQPIGCNFTQAVIEWSAMEARPDCECGSTLVRMDLACADCGANPYS